MTYARGSGLKKCPFCNWSFSPNGAKYCVSCDMRFGASHDEDVECPECGLVNDTTQNECLGCGAELGTDSIDPDSLDGPLAAPFYFPRGDYFPSSGHIHGILLSTMEAMKPEELDVLDKLNPEQFREWLRDTKEEIRKANTHRVSDSGEVHMSALPAQTTGRNPNDDRSDAFNPNNPASKAAKDNRSNQLNPSSLAHRRSRGRK